MSLYLPIQTKGSVAIAICGRCRKKVYYSSLKKDPNNGQWYCPDCCDGLDPYKLPSRQVEEISLAHPRVDEDITNG